MSKLSDKPYIYRTTCRPHSIAAYLYHEVIKLLIDAGAERRQAIEHHLALALMELEIKKKEKDHEPI